MNSVPKSHTSLKAITTTRNLLKLVFRAGSVWEFDRELPNYMKFNCSKCHISGPFKETQNEYNIQPQLLKVEVEHELITLSN